MVKYVFLWFLFCKSSVQVGINSPWSGSIQSRWLYESHYQFFILPPRGFFTFPPRGFTLAILIICNFIPPVESSFETYHVCSKSIHDSSQFLDICPIDWTPMHFKSWAHDPASKDALNNRLILQFCDHRVELPEIWLVSYVRQRSSSEPWRVVSDVYLSNCAASPLYTYSDQQVFQSANCRRGTSRLALRLG